MWPAAELGSLYLPECTYYENYQESLFPFQLCALFI